MMDLYTPGELTDEQVTDIATQIADLMEEKDLMCDTFPTQNESDGKWELAISEEDGNTEDYARFDSEEQAERVAMKLEEILEARNSGAEESDDK